MVARSEGEYKGWFREAGGGRPLRSWASGSLHYLAVTAPLAMGGWSSSVGGTFVCRNLSFETPTAADRGKNAAPTSG